MTGSRPAAAEAAPAELIERAARGDLAAFARIVRLHHVEMTRVALVVTGDIDAAIHATHAAWPDARLGLRHPLHPADLGQWLCAKAAGQAVEAAKRSASRELDATEAQDDGAAAGAGDEPDEGLVRALERMEPEERALLALRHVAGIDLSDLAQLDRRSRIPVAARLERLRAAIDWSQGDGSRPAGDGARVEAEGDSAPEAAGRSAGRRLLDYALVAVDPVDADAAARWARAEEVEERTRLVSIAVSAVGGALVAGFPYLAWFFHHR